MYVQVSLLYIDSLNQNLKSYQIKNFENLKLNFLPITQIPEVKSQYGKKEIS